MNHPNLLIAGASIAGFMATQFIAAFAKMDTPFTFDLLGGVATGLIVAAFVL